MCGKNMYMQGKNVFVIHLEKAVQKKKKNFFKK